jgi:hypothetical protein
VAPKRDWPFEGQGPLSSAAREFGRPTCARRHGGSPARTVGHAATRAGVARRRRKTCSIAIDVLMPAR